MGPEQWLVIVTCRDEAHHVEMLKRFQGEGYRVGRCWGSVKPEA
jgi:hypothetical protein